MTREEWVKGRCIASRPSLPAANLRIKHHLSQGILPFSAISMSISAHTCHPAHQVTSHPEWINRDVGQLIIRQHWPHVPRLSGTLQHNLSVRTRTLLHSFLPNYIPEPPLKAWLRSTPPLHHARQSYGPPNEALPTPPARRVASFSYINKYPPPG